MSRPNVGSDLLQRPLNPDVQTKWLSSVFRVPPIDAVSSSGLTCRRTEIRTPDYLEKSSVVNRPTDTGSLAVGSLNYYTLFQSPRVSAL